MSLSPDIIAQQQELLSQHRRTLAALLQQQAALGGIPYTPPGVINGITEARLNIRNIKKTLRESGIYVEEALIDEEILNPKVISEQKANLVTNSEPGAMVIQHINISGGTVGDIIGQQIIQQNPPSLPSLYQLRAPISDFVGRINSIEQLVQNILRSEEGVAPIVAIRGMGGLGKTELAYKVSGILQRNFPDAQLLVDLQGTSKNPLSPEHALRTVIHSFEREATLSDDPNELQAIYRSVLTNKRILILADDAKDAAQIRRLLPPVGSAVLVTTRNRFALPGMFTLDLDTLLPSEAETLLLEICPRLESHAMDLAKLCGYLPLALRVCASTLASDDSRNVSTFLEDFRSNRFKHLKDLDNPDDDHTNVEVSLTLSYDELSDLARSVLNQLSVFPTTFNLEAIHQVVVIDGDVEENISLLRRRSFLEWNSIAIRYDLHDLVRAFGLARLNDVHAAKLRHAQYYSKVVLQAEDVYTEGDVLKGLALFDLERINIDAAWNWIISRSDLEAQNLSMEYSNSTILIGDLRYDRKRERIPQLNHAILAAEAVHDKQMKATFLNGIGNIHRQLGDVRKSIDYYLAALAAIDKEGFHELEGILYGSLGNAYDFLGKANEAIEYFNKAESIAIKLGRKRLQGIAIGNKANSYHIKGEDDKAIDYYKEALKIVGDIGELYAEGAFSNNLGNIYREIRDFQKAIELYNKCLDISRRIGDSYSEASALGNLGHVFSDIGDDDRAKMLYEQQLRITRDIGDRQGEANALWSLGLIFENEGELAKAVEVMRVRVEYEKEIMHDNAEEAASYFRSLQRRLESGKTTGARKWWHGLIKKNRT